MTLGRRAPLERLALFLLELDRRQAPCTRSLGESKIPISRADTGDYLGLESETVSRLFTKLKLSQVIQVYLPSRVRLKDRAILEGLAEGRGVSLVPPAN